MTRMAGERGRERGRERGGRRRDEEAQETAPRVVDAMWETGETWVERGKNVDKKGLVR